jgi:hypothetical protein
MAITFAKQAIIRVTKKDFAEWLFEDDEKGKGPSTLRPFLS